MIIKIVLIIIRLLTAKLIKLRLRIGLPIIHFKNDPEAGQYDVGLSLTRETRLHYVTSMV